MSESKETTSSSQPAKYLTTVIIIVIEIVGLSILNYLGVIPGIWGYVFTAAGIVLAAVEYIVRLPNHLPKNYKYSERQAIQRNFFRGTKTINRKITAEEVSAPGTPRNSILPLLMLCIATGPLLWYSFNISSYFLHYPCTMLSISPDSVGATTISLGLSGIECIGISDSRLVLDTDRSDANIKLQAADAIIGTQAGLAPDLWQKADPNDAEALIYQEDYAIHKSGGPYIALVVATTLTGDARSVRIGRATLQGAYMAQKAYNDTHPDRPLFLYIANSGSNAQYATLVARQIIAISASAGPHHPLLGVMGWPFNAQSANANYDLGHAQIPMVSPTATGDRLTTADNLASKFFFQIAPSDMQQVSQAALYAKNTLHAKKAVILSDSSDPDDQELAQDFDKQFQAIGEKIVSSKDDSSDTLHNLSALLANTDAGVIYFTGNIEDLSALMKHLPTTGKLAHVQVLTADRFDELNGQDMPNPERLHFTIAATPGEWHWLGKPEQMTTFFKTYQQIFGSQEQVDGNVMLSYDATLTLLRGCELAGANLTPASLGQALAGITGGRAMQGISGQISFHNGVPSDKVLIVAHLDDAGHLEEDALQGGYW